MPYELIKTFSIVIPTSLLASIIGSVHDLSNNTGGDNNEVCVYCHTPHAANVEFDAPLWNKALTATTFKMYGAATSGVAGETIAGTPTDASPSGATLACLSCHDGVSAINSVVNAPGSGNYDPDGVIIGSSTYDTIDMANDESKAVGLYGDLTNDHPVSITYVEGAASLKPVSTPLVGWKGATEISDILRDGKVQCVSCHDPHYTYWGRFLRAKNTSSELCMSCHDK